MTDGPAPSELRELAAAFAREAGELALAGRRRLGAGRPGHDTKSSATDPVTEWDRAAEALLVERIRDARPDDSIIGEEGAEYAGTSALQWHIDPIDGTVNFLYDRAEWCTSVGVVDAQGPLAGAVFAPAGNELFSAARGQGATLDGRPISVSSTTDLSVSLLATGFSYSPEMRLRQAHRLLRVLPAVRDIRRCGSAALDLCAVAAARADAYVEENLNSWDVAAGMLIAAEAGAVCTSIDGGPPVPAALMVAAPGIHDDLVVLFSSVDAPS